MSKHFNLANEQAILVAALKDLSMRKRILATITPDDFGGDRHQNIFEAIVECGNGDIDKHVILSLSDDVGGHEYLELLFGMDVPVDLDSHLEIFYRFAARIKALEKAKESVEILDDPTNDYDECEKTSLEVVRAIREPYYRTSVGSDVAKEHLKLLERRWSGQSEIFVPTCIPVLDEYLTEGIASGRLIVVCGRTGHGKSGITLEWIYQILKHSNRKILIEALEVGRTKFIDQMISRWTGIPYVEIVRDAKNMGLSKRKKIKNAIDEFLSSGRLTVIDLDVYRDIPKRTNDAVLDRFEQFIAGGDYDIVVSDMFERKLFRRDIGSISDALIREQHLVKRYEYCSMLVHQLKRLNDTRKDTRPQLDDLYGSGYWEQVADVVLGIYRERKDHPYLIDDNMEMLLLKQKSGPFGQTFIAEVDATINQVGMFRLKTEEDEIREPRFPQKQ